MTMYFDFKVDLKENAILSCVEWHQQLPLLAVGFSLPESHHAYLNIFNQMGELLPDLNELDEENNVISAISWHPTKKILIAGFRSGDMQLWNGQPEFISVPSPHSSPIVICKWSFLGSRFISSDLSGTIVGWKMESRGSVSRVFQTSVQAAPMSLVFCCGRPGLDVNTLAKKAVAGDERALDIFSTWRPKTGTSRPTFSSDNVDCYVGTVPDKIHFVNEVGNSTNVATCDCKIRSILHHPKKNLLIALLKDHSVEQYSTSSVDGKLQNISKVKLNDANTNIPFIWAADDMLVCATFDYALRCYEINSSSTFLLYGKTDGREKQTFTTISYHDFKGVLCAGSTGGSVTMWKKKKSNANTDEFTELCSLKMKSTIICSMWGLQHAAIAIQGALFVLQEHDLCWCYNKKVSAVQKTASELAIVSNGQPVKLNADLKIIGVSVCNEHVAVWSGKTVVVYKLTDLTALNVLGSFSCECESILIFEQSLILLPNSVFQNGKLLITTFQGTVKQSLDSDGQPIAMHLNQSYLVTVTIIGMLQVWDLSRREAKLHIHPKDLVESISDFGEVVMVRVNCTGTRVSLTVANSNLIPSPSIYVWEMETDAMISYQFPDANGHALEDRRYITSHYWDSMEPFLLVCETRCCGHDDIGDNREDEKQPIYDDIVLTTETSAKASSDNECTIGLPKLVTLYVSKENGIVVQDEATMTSDYLNLLGIDIPYFIILRKSATELFASADQLLMNYFDEVSAHNEAIRKSVIQFSFSLSVGNLDDAYKTIRNINNNNVWNNLTKMCIRKKRLDVAQVCLGNISDARGVSILRHLDSESLLEVKLAALALHMGLIEEAENLYKSVDRYDLLNKMYQNLNRWNEALKIAEQKDRIHLRNTYDAYGHYLENQGNIQEAMRMYELANTHRKHIPRLLLHSPAALEKYVQKSQDLSLMKWWAQYVECTGNIDLAMKYYQQANDYMSTVRLHCFLGNTEQAAEVAASSNDPAACYQLARHYESIGHIENAVTFFIKSHVYGNAIRICKENGLDDLLWQISSYAGEREKLDAAKYFENIDPGRSVTLYQKAKHYHRALYLAFRYDLQDTVEVISMELHPDSQADMLEKCGTYFLQKEIFDVAIKLLARAKKFDEAILVCTNQHVVLTEEAADLLTPPAGYSNRNQILNELGEYLFLQGNYHLATKKFTQAGNKAKAMKALLKSGDTEKIIFFANVSREKEIYIMAANYLQTLDWHMQPELLKHIINFYTKGKAPHLLANFYIACAQIEVDEYGNYEKSIGALNEASRCLSKDPDQYGQALEYIVKKVSTVKKFLEIKRQFEKGENDLAMNQARQLLNSDLDLVRRGDVYSIMIEHLTKCNEWNSATQLTVEMKKNLPKDNLLYYIPKETLLKLGIENSEGDAETTPDEGLEEIEDIT